MWVGDAAHLAMSVSMIVMLWFTDVGDLWGLQAAGFVLATLWFLLTAVHSHEEPAWVRFGQVNHGVAMAAMAWMFLGVHDSPGHGSYGTAAHVHHVTSGTATVVTVLFAGWLGVSALWWLWVSRRPAAFDGGRQPTRSPSYAAFVSWFLGAPGEAAFHSLMSAAMSAALLAAL
ncbi:DUF5134 domain-containing protein [Micromonospora sp. NBC_01813]|uniref:DUF5134 domain-containing protein n=1 Tax=Micromonospora sp. NBC_01813 TaxID=2975988 RepID=UPI002DD853A8|nr:DUF5134 domain-containing protein [Micromonospora sp. NBC_01813]WSA10798.1 DUF5134 domain-containing protein [Micromonospora sp. NBC_01813]